MYTKLQQNTRLSPRNQQLFITFNTPERTPLSIKQTLSIKQAEYPQKYQCNLSINPFQQIQRSLRIPTNDNINSNNNIQCNSNNYSNRYSNNKYGNKYNNDDDNNDDDNKQLKINDDPIQLQFSLIAPNTPTYSQLYSSLNCDKYRYFQKQSKQNKNQILIEEHQYQQLSPINTNMTNNKISNSYINNNNNSNRKQLSPILPLKSQYYDSDKNNTINNKNNDKNNTINNNQQQIPTFFIKIPENFRMQRIQEKATYRKKENQQIKKKMEEIYAGNFKISMAVS